jgi:hypothetical protein
MAAPDPIVSKSRRWSVRAPLWGWFLLTIVALVIAAVGFSVCRSYLRSESEILSRWPMTAPAERHVRKCKSVVEHSFDSKASDADLDQLLGARVEKYERVHGPRIRIDGTAKYTFKGGARVVGASARPFSIKLIDQSGFDIEWPQDVVGRRIIVEGCLSRIYYPRELQHPDTSHWSDREKRTKNFLRGWPSGFVYELRSFKYELKDDSPNARDEQHN